MKTQAITAVLVLAPILGAQTMLPAGTAEDGRARIEAKLLLTRDAMKAALGADPGENVVIVEVKYTPVKTGKYYLDHDEFLLRTDNDGQRAKPMFPTQLAGSAVMVIGSRGGTQGQVGTQQRRVPYGIPGGSGYPSTLPGTQPPIVGSSTADNSEATASIEEGKTSPEQKALLKALTDKRLPEGEVEGPVSGLLYFVYEGKHKLKHYEFIYRKAPPRLSVRFIDPSSKK
ncbi:MAG TPA: hypothetical protein PKJ41_11350 [Bryobacteraceae bacterium]|nr:hypothetical protein [Bryobacteraceae bacterium]HPT26553.1 hypothetical protein [Bryobacteraceae bacterium]